MLIYTISDLIVWYIYRPAKPTTDLPQKFTSLLRLQRKLDLDISNADLALLKRQRSILKMADTPLHGASAGIRREE